MTIYKPNVQDSYTGLGVNNNTTTIDNPLLTPTLTPTSDNFVATSDTEAMEIYYALADIYNKDLTIKANITAEELDAIILSFVRAKEGREENSCLIGMGEAILKASEATGFDPLYILAHAAQETGWGTSAIVKDKNNWFGIGAWDRSPYELAYSYSSLEEGLIEGMKWIKEHYYDNGQTTLDSMISDPSHCYASAKEEWRDSIASIILGSIYYLDTNRGSRQWRQSGGEAIPTGIYGDGVRSQPPVVHVPAPATGNDGEAESITAKPGDATIENPKPSQPSTGSGSGSDGSSGSGSSTVNLSDEINIPDETPEESNTPYQAWPTTDLTKNIPPFQTNNGKINWNNTESFSYSANGVSVDEYNTYLTQLQNSGFTNTSDNISYIKNDCKVYLTYDNGTMKISMFKFTNI